MKYILKGDRQKLEKLVGKAVEEVFKDYKVTYIGDCIKTVTPVGELYMNAKCYEEVFIECIEEKMASYELRNMMTHKTIYHQTENGLPLSRHGIEWQNFTPIKREEILKIIKNFEENE